MREVRSNKCWTGCPLIIFRCSHKLQEELRDFGRKLAHFLEVCAFTKECAARLCTAKLITLAPHMIFCLQKFEMKSLPISLSYIKVCACTIQLLFHRWVRSVSVPEVTYRPKWGRGSCYRDYGISGKRTLWWIGWLRSRHAVFLHDVVVCGTVGVPQLQLTGKFSDTQIIRPWCWIITDIIINFESESMFIKFIIVQFLARSDNAC